MAGFDFFSQPQGPAINISLFQDAASAGINAGNRLPSTTSSIIQGVQEGVKTGQQLIQGQQQIERNQQIIDQAPIEAAMNEQKLSALEMENEIQELKLEVARNDKDSFLRVERNKLKAEALKSQQMIEDFENQDVIKALLGSPDLATRRSVLTKPELKGTILRHPEMLKSITGQLAGRGDLTPEEEKNALAAVDFTLSQQQRQQKEMLQNRFVDEVAKEQDKRMKDVMDDGELTDIMTRTGITDIVEFGRRVETRKGAVAGSYQVFLDGKKLEMGLGLDETSNKSFAGWKNFLTVNKLIPPKPAEIEVLGPDAAAGPDKPYSDALAGAGSQGTPKDTNEDIVEQRRRKLAQDSTTRQRMLDSGRYKLPTGVFGFKTEGEGGIAVPAAPAPTPAAPLTPAGGIFGFSSSAAGGVSVPAQETPAPTAQPTQPASTPTSAGSAKNIAQPLSDEVESWTLPYTEEERRTTDVEAVPLPGSDPDLVQQQQLKKEQRTASLTLPQIKNVIEYEVPGSAKAVWAPSPEKVKNVLRDPMLRGLDPFEKAFVAHESAGLPRAKNKGSSAEGYFQLTTAAAKDEKKNKSIPRENIEGGIARLNRLKEKYHGNKTLVAFAYHVGEGTVAAALDRTGDSAEYEDLLTAFWYIKSRPLTYPKLQDALANMKEVAKYPLSISAYERVFNAIDRRKLKVR